MSLHYLVKYECLLVKNFENRIIVEVMAKSLVSCIFFDSRCRSSAVIEQPCCVIHQLLSCQILYECLNKLQVNDLESHSRSLEEAQII